MIINIAYIKAQLSMRTENSRCKPIGSLIKFKRQEYHMTLEEAADGICSISYLSKLENNRIDPNDKFVEPLIKKLKITPFDDTQSSHQEDLEFILKRLLQLKSIDNSFIIKYKGSNDYQSKLVLIGYYIANQEFDLAFNAYYDIKTYIKNLNEFECSYLLNMLSIIAYYIGDYSDSYSLLRLLTLTNSGECSLIQKCLFVKNAIKMNKFFILNDLYDNLITELMSYQYYDIADKIIIEKITYYAKYQDNHQISSLLQRLSKISADEKDFILAKNYFYQNRTDCSLKLLKRIYHLNEEYLLLYLKILDQFNEGKEILRVINNQNQKLDFGKDLYIRYLKTKYLHANEELIAFFKCHFFDSKILISEYEILTTFLEEGKNAFKNIHYYKDALTFEKKVTTRIKALLFT